MLGFSPKENGHESLLGNTRERIWSINTVHRDFSADHGGLVWALLILHVWGYVSFQGARVERSQRGVVVAPEGALSETVQSFMETPTHTHPHTCIDEALPHPFYPVLSRLSCR